MEFIWGMFSSSEGEAMRKLWQGEDSEARYEIANHIAKEWRKGGINTRKAEDELLLMTSSAPFRETDEEAVYVSSAIIYGLKQPEILPTMVDVQKGEIVDAYEFSSKCLVSLSLFYDYMEKRSERRGAPKPEWYRKQGISTINRLGQKEVACNFDNWTEFIGNVFI